MTTARSSLRVLQAQADRIAAEIKRIERGELPAAVDPAGKLVAARERDSFTFGVVMDDKTLQIEMAWATIKTTSEAGLAALILLHMREQRNTVH